MKTLVIQFEHGNLLYRIVVDAVKHALEACEPDALGDLRWAPLSRGRHLPAGWLGDVLRSAATRLAFGSVPAKPAPGSAGGDEVRYVNLGVFTFVSVPA